VIETVPASSSILNNSLSPYYGADYSCCESCIVGSSASNLWDYWPLCIIPAPALELFLRAHSRSPDDNPTARSAPEVRLPTANLCSTVLA